MTVKVFSSGLLAKAKGTKRNMSTSIVFTVLTRLYFLNLAVLAFFKACPSSSINPA